MGAGRADVAAGDVEGGSAVGWDGGVELGEPGGEMVVGVAEGAGAVGEGLVGESAGEGDVGPVVVEPVLAGGGGVVAPAFALAEAVVGVLFAREPFDLRAGPCQLTGYRAGVFVGGGEA